MPRIDAQAEMKPILALNTESRTASVNGPVIDTAGYKGSTYTVHTAATTTADADNRMNFKIQHGDLANGNDMVDVPAEDVTGSAVIDAATDDSVVIGKLSHVPQTVRGKRYERLVGTVTGTFSSVMGATVVLNGPRKPPVA